VAPTPSGSGLGGGFAPLPNLPQERIARAKPALEREYSDRIAAALDKPDEKVLYYPTKVTRRRN
jgi:hypothetical protein